MIKRFGGAMVISIWLISGQPGLAQDSKLIAEAKKEGGKVVVYSSMETSIAESVGNAFKNKTGIEMEFWRASSTKVMDRALNEHRAGRPLADVVVTIADPMLIMQREGVFAKYDSPAALAYPKELIDPNLGPSYRNLLIGIVYNKNVIRPGDAPASLEDLVKPQYKGKLVTRSHPTHNHDAVAGEPAQAHGQRESRKVYSRSGSDQTDPCGISAAAGRACRHRRDSDRHHSGPLHLCLWPDRRPLRLCKTAENARRRQLHCPQ